MPDYTIDTSKPILVTGATGYIAGWIVKMLLQGGATVHGTVRDPNNAKKVAHLKELAANSPGMLKLFKADLNEAGSFDEAMAGCGIVMHTASPYTLRVDDPQRDLVDPALNGTRTVLEAANRTDSVTRVVLTSSCAAIFGDIADCADAPGGVLTEEIWNTTSSLDHSPYSYSKTVAEKAAWEMAGAQDRWKLVVINPAGVFGPAVGGDFSSAESFSLIKTLADGTMKTGAPHFEVGFVDVRDVAEAHIAAAFLPDAEGRHILAKETWNFLQAGQHLARKFPDYPFPKRHLPKWLVWLAGPILDSAMTRKFVSRAVGHPWRADNTRSRQRLGIEYRPIETALDEMFTQMVDAGMVKPG